MSIFDSHHHHHHNDPPDISEMTELALLREQIRLQKIAIAELEALRRELAPGRLSRIKIQFETQGDPMPVGPLTISVAQPFTASVVGFDQNGAPFNGQVPAATFAVDNSAVATVDPASGAGVGVSAGVASVSAAVVSAEGLNLSDTETVTVTAVVPVLSSIKVSLDVAASARR